MIPLAANTALMRWAAVAASVATVANVGTGGSTAAAPATPAATTPAAIVFSSGTSHLRFLLKTQSDVPASEDNTNLPSCELIFFALLARNWLREQHLRASAGADLRSCPVLDPVWAGKLRTHTAPFV